MAIVLPAVMGGISIALSASESARRQAEASTLAHGKLAELVSANSWQDIASEGDFSDWPDYRWKAQLSTWDSGASQLSTGLQLGRIQQPSGGQEQSSPQQTNSIEQLDVTVTWAQSGSERSVTMSTLVNTANDSSGMSAGTTGVGP